MVYTFQGAEALAIFNKNGAISNKGYSTDGEEVYSYTPKSIKIMQYNVGQWYQGRNSNVPSDKFDLYYSLQNGMITEHNPDILIIEEYWKLFSSNGYEAKTMLQQHFSYIHEQGGESGYFGRCVCSKYPIFNYAVNLFSNEPNRYYDQCDVLINGVSIKLIITHLGTTKEIRELQITELINKLKEFKYFILGGDMNTPYNADPTTIEEIERFSDEGFVLANCGEFGDIDTAPSGGWIGWIDNIITSNTISITDAYADTTKVELYNQGIIAIVDHLPLISTCQI